MSLIRVEQAPMEEKKQGREADEHLRRPRPPNRLGEYSRMVGRWREFDIRVYQKKKGGVGKAPEADEN